jgi:hypothetical protein
MFASLLGIAASGWVSSQQLRSKITSVIPKQFDNAPHHRSMHGITQTGQDHTSSVRSDSDQGDGGNVAVGGESVASRPAQIDPNIVPADCTDRV